MTDLQTLQAQVNDLYNRLNNIVALRSVTLATDAPGTPVTVTSASLTNLTPAFALDANDANATTIYRLTASGVLGIPSSGAQALTFGLAGWAHNSGTSPALASFTIGASPLATYPSAAFAWTIVSYFSITAAGASGGVRTFMFGSAGQTAANLGNVVSGVPNSWALAGFAGGVAIDTTAGTSLALQAKYGAVVSGQSVQCYGSMLERIGP